MGRLLLGTCHQLLQFHKIGCFPRLTPPPSGWLAHHRCCAVVGFPLFNFCCWTPQRFEGLQNSSQLNAGGCTDPSGQGGHILGSRHPRLELTFHRLAPPSTTAPPHSTTFHNASAPRLAPFILSFNFISLCFLLCFIFFI